MTKPEDGSGEALGTDDIDWGGSSPGLPVSGAPWSDEVDSSVARDNGADEGCVLGRYELRGELGRGGMGQVLVAHDRLLGRDVALKRLVPGLSRREEIGKRLAQEARITGLLEHPAIVPVLDAGRDDSGAPFYVMRLIRGRTLAAAATEAKDLAGRLRLLRHFLDACEAVGFAHRAGVVHRDVKPDNILVGEFGETQVADWGLARWDGAADGPNGATDPDHALADAPELTRIGAVVGTPAYMSPEQARGERATSASDVFSLGVVLWQLVAGVHPLAGRSSDEMLASMRDDEVPSLRHRLPDAPPELAAIVERATERAPDKRYENAKQLADEVSRFLDGRRVHAHNYTPLELLERLVTAWRAPLAVAAVALVVVATVAAIAFQRTARERDRAVDAEESAVSARLDADINLADSLLQHALSSMARDQRALAEVFAAAAVQRVDSPEARGVLAGFGVAPRPTLVGRIKLPACARLHPSATGDEIGCARPEGGSVWRWKGDRYERSWQIETPFGDVLVADGSGKTVLFHRTYQVVANTATGKIHGRLTAFRPSRNSEPATAGRSVLLHGPAGVVLIMPGQVTSTDAFQCPGIPPLSIATLASDGERVALVCDDGTVLIARPLEGRRSKAYRIDADFAPERGATAAAWLPGDATVVVGTRNGMLALVHVKERRKQLIGRLAGGQIASIQPHPSLPLAAVVSDRGQVTVWSLAEDVVIARLPGAGVTAVRWRAERELWTYGEQLQRWRLPDDPVAIRVWSGPTRPGLSSVTVSPDGRTIAVLSGSGELRVHDHATGRLTFADQFQRRVLKGGQFRDNGRRFAAWAAGAPALRTYSTNPWKPLATLPGAGLKRAVWMRNDWLIVAPYSNVLAAIKGFGPDRKVVRLAEGFFQDLDTPDDESVTFATDEKGALFRIDEGDPPRIVPLRTDGAVARVAVSGDGKVLALLVGDRLRTLAVPEMRPIGSVETLVGRTYGIALSRDGSLLSAGLRDGSARVWDVRSSKLIGVLRGHEKLVADVAFDGSDPQLVTASWDGSVRTWDLRALRRPVSELVDEINAAWDMSLATALRHSAR